MRGGRWPSGNTTALSLGGSWFESQCVAAFLRIGSYLWPVDGARGYRRHCASSPLSEIADSPWGERALELLLYQADSSTHLAINCDSVPEALWADGLVCGGLLRVLRFPHHSPGERACSLGTGPLGQAANILEVFPNDLSQAPRRHPFSGVKTWFAAGARPGPPLVVAIWKKKKKKSGLNKLVAR